MRKLTTIFLILLISGCKPAEPTRALADPGQVDNIRRLASILDYIAADYGVAVTDGVITNDAEYQEQLAFLQDAEALVDKIPSSSLELTSELAGIRKLVRSKSAAKQVAQRCRRLRRELLRTHGIVLAPTAPPSFERGAELYQVACIACHGNTGKGDGSEAARHDPPPRSFHDDEVMAELTAVRAFNALTDGIDGTAMASFGVYSAADRWNLAFYVLTMRHDAKAAKRGEKSFASVGNPVATSATRLAAASDAELVAPLAGKLDDKQTRDALAFLRRQAPYQTSEARFASTRRLLDGAVAAHQAGNGDPALVSAAYLDGFEPHEGALRSADAELVLRIEEHFLSLRKIVQQQDTTDRVQQKALLLGVLLDRAEETLTQGGGKSVAFVAAFLVIAREGLEAALLVMLLLGLARSAGAQRDVAAVHTGWLAALVLGVATWFASGPLAEMSGASRELIEGVVALLAATVLLLAGHFVLARLDAKRRVEALKRRFESASAGRRRAVLFALGFVAVYREAFEIVLFLRAILLDAAGSSWAVAGGVFAGVLACVLLVFLLVRLGRRINPGPVLSASGSLLCLLAVILAGKGVRSLQEAGTIGITPLSLPRVDWLGLYPSLQSVSAQLAVLGIFVLIALISMRRRTEAPSPV